MTFSLLGQCQRTGQFGGVITTSSPAVGARCVYIRPGVGGVLTQHRTDPRLGPRGLDLLESGCSAAETVAALVAGTPQIAWRQLAVLAADGSSAAYHGEEIYSIRADASAPGCVAIGNIIDHPDVPRRMVEAFIADPSLSMGERLLRAIEAGEAAGGETGKVHSAQMIAYLEQPFPHFDLRIDWSETPLEDLRALWERARDEADAFMRRVLEPESVPNIPALVEAAARRKRELGLA